MSLLTIFRRPALRPHAPYSATSPRPSVLKTILAAAPLKPAPRNRPEQSALLQSLGLTPVPQPEETIAPIETAHLLAGYPLSYYCRPNSEAGSPAFPSPFAAGEAPTLTFLTDLQAHCAAQEQQIAQLTARIADLQNRLRWSHDRESTLRADLHRSQERLPLPANVIPFTPARAKSPRPAA